jgi:hypothetical protein
MPGGELFREDQLFPKLGCVAYEQRPPKIGSDSTWIIRRNGQDHNQDEIIPLSPLDLCQGVGRNIDMVIRMERGRIHKDKGQTRLINRLKPLERGLSVMIKYRIPLLLREPK